MELSQTGLELIKSFESLRLTAYKAVSTEKYYTIGYGHYGSDVTKGMTITQSVANELLKNDVATFVAHVNTYQKKYNFNQNQFDALVSFAYNVGSISGLTNKGTRTISEISSKITAYNKSGGKVLNGLVKRRAKEKALFDTAISTTKTTTTSSSSSYYPQYTGSSTSIVDALKAVGETDTSLTHRKKIATANGLDTTSTTTMNTRLLFYLKSGKLIKV